MNIDQYIIRNAIVDLIGNSIIYMHNNESVDSRYTRDTLLDILQERVHDIHAFTRSNCLKVIEQVFTEESLPLNRIVTMTALAGDRMKDKSSFVRKSAMKVK